MIKLICLVLFLISGFPAFCQFIVSDAEIMIQSRHIWRGSKLGTAPAIEPSVTFSSGRFSLNFWAAATVNNSYSEIDVVPSWQSDYFQLTLFDYYNPVLHEKNQFLNFEKGKNRHSLELALDNYTIDEQRLKWMVGTFLLGDKNEVTGKSFYSTYIELKYPFSVIGLQVEPFAGLTPFRGYYAGTFAFINTGVSVHKGFKLSEKFVVPSSMSFVVNPDQHNYFLTFAIGIAFSKPL